MKIFLDTVASDRVRDAGDRPLLLTPSPLLLHELPRLHLLLLHHGHLVALVHDLLLRPLLCLQQHFLDKNVVGLLLVHERVVRNEP